MNHIAVSIENTSRSILPNEIASHINNRARTLDRGDERAFSNVQILSQSSISDMGLPGEASRISEMANVIVSVAELCMSSAFSLWAHRMAIEYLHRCTNANLQHLLQQQIRPAKVAGSTALATAFMDTLGLRSMPVQYRRNNDHIILNGSIPWASNLRAEGFVAVLGAAGDSGDRIIVAVPSNVEGLVVDPYPDLMALQATDSSSFGLYDCQISLDHIISYEAADFLKAVRPTFLTLQSALCFGIGNAAKKSAEESLSGIAKEFHSDYDSLCKSWESLRSRYENTLDNQDNTNLVELLSIRLASAQVAQSLVTLEAKILGGRAYVNTSPTARRMREAAFLPVQSPTEAQLLWELQQ
tara:strand:+ start:462 stop:1529 length:1068 start_codon:yes stop_codon:yes gene_type:complete